MHWIVLQTGVLNASNINNSFPIFDPIFYLANNKEHSAPNLMHKIVIQKSVLSMNKENCQLQFFNKSRLLTAFNDIVEGISLKKYVLPIY